MEVVGLFHLSNKDLRHIQLLMNAHSLPGFKLRLVEYRNHDDTDDVEVEKVLEKLSCGQVSITVEFK